MEGKRETGEKEREIATGVEGVVSLFLFADTGQSNWVENKLQVIRDRFREGGQKLPPKHGQHKG